MRQITYASDSIGTPGPVDDSHAAYAPIMEREREKEGGGEGERNNSLTIIKSRF